MKFKIELPGLLRWLGLGKWLRERALRLPSEALPDAALLAEIRAWQNARQAGRNTLTPEDWWRGVENVQAQLISDGIQTKLAGGK